MSLMTKVSGLPIDVKAVGDDGTIEGYGSIFGNVDDYGEIVMPGAFAASLKDIARNKAPSVKMLWQHSWDQPIGLWNRIEEDNRGLKVSGRLLVDASSQAREAYELVKAGAVEGLSIGYRTLQSEIDKDNADIRRLTKLKLMEVSIVTFAANEAARVELVKHLLAAGDLPTTRQFEELLREAGFSKSLAAVIAGKAAPHLRGEPDGEANDAAAVAAKLIAALRG